jgi:two-component system, OmpR family, response regulator RegX3
MEAAGPTRSGIAAAVPRTLIVEGDGELAAQLESLLRNYGFETETVTTREAALGRAGAVDLVLLDPSLPDGDGLEICGLLSAQTALVMVSDRADEADRVAALELGADDYVVRPFGPRELVARCRAILRRRRASAWQSGTAVRVGELEVDLERHEARCDGRPLPLTTKELALLMALARRPGELVRREELAETVWGTDLWSVTRSLDVHMSALRRKLGDATLHSVHVHTVHGLGFRLLAREWAAGSEPAEMAS